MRPHEVLRFHPGICSVPREFRELREVLASDDRGERDVESESGKQLRAGERPDQRAGSPDRIVRLRARAVDRDLKLDALAGERRQEASPRSPEKRGVREHNHLTLPFFADRADNLLDVRPKEGLPSRQVEALDSERERFAHDPPEQLGRKAGNLARPGADETVGAREVAGVVGVQPELVESRRCRIAAADVRRPLER